MYGVPRVTVHATPCYTRDTRARRCFQRRKLRRHREPCARGRRGLRPSVPQLPRRRPPSRRRLARRCEASPFGSCRQGLSLRPGAGPQGPHPHPQAQRRSGTPSHPSVRGSESPVSQEARRCPPASTSVPRRPAGALATRPPHGVPTQGRGVLCERRGRPSRCPVARVSPEPPPACPAPGHGCAVPFRGVRAGSPVTGSAIGCGRAVVL